MQVFVDRTRHQAAAAVVATWLITSVALIRQLGPSPLEIAVGSVVAAPVIILGFAATSRCRPLPQHDRAELAKLTGLSLAAGVALGALILVVNIGLVSIDPRVARVAGSPSDPQWEPWLRALEAAPVEEVGFRLAIMGIIGWAVARYSKRSVNPFTVALWSSALVFGLVHLPHFSVAGLGLVLGNCAAGLVYGWLFWRWGLPYAMLCHFSTGLMIQSFGPTLLS